MNHVKNLIIGCGLSGATLAHKIATELNEDVFIIDKNEHIGGNCYDYWDKNGICVHKYGAHIFHTNSKEVWDYLSQFTDWYPYSHEVTACIDGMQVPIPFNLHSIHQVFPKSIADTLETKLLTHFGFNVKVPILDLKKTGDLDLIFLANYVYEKVFLHYTLKQWGLTPEELDPSVTGRVPVYISHDNRYFQDTYQGIPLKGYSAMMEKMIKHPKIKVQLNTTFADIKETVTYDRLFYTGPIDEFFDYEHGPLPYRSLYFKTLEFDYPYFQNKAVINYPTNYDFTRIIECKYFLNTSSAKTIVHYEYPQPYIEGENERYYPIVKDENANLYNKYLISAKKLDNTYFLGRLGDYKYYDMDKAVERALQLFSTIL